MDVGGAAHKQGQETGGDCAGRGEGQESRPPGDVRSCGSRPKQGWGRTGAAAREEPDERRCFRAPAPSNLNAKHPAGDHAAAACRTHDFGARSLARWAGTKRPQSAGDVTTSLPSPGRNHCGVNGKLHKPLVMTSMRHSSWRWTTRSKYPRSSGVAGAERTGRLAGPADGGNDKWPEPRKECGSSRSFGQVGMAVSTQDAKGRDWDIRRAWDG